MPAARVRVLAAKLLSRTPRLTKSFAAKEPREPNVAESPLGHQPPAGRSEQAAAAFETLLALDPAYPARQELRAAGVAQATVAALYPEGFAELEVHLIAHLDGITDAELLSSDIITSDLAHAAWGSLPPALLDVVDVAAETDDEAAATAGHQTIAEYLHGRLFGEAVAAENEPAFQRARARGQAGTQIAYGIWWAHWLMAHRLQLQAENQAATDVLMLAVARAIKL